MDEMLFEEEFTDDEEAKKFEVTYLFRIYILRSRERLKMYKSANTQREGSIDESDREKNEDGKAIKKLIRNLEKNSAYDSEERNPYASPEAFPSQPSNVLSNAPGRKRTRNTHLPQTLTSHAAPMAPALSGYSVSRNAPLE